MLGYAVECALKSCIAKQFRQDEVPDRTLVNSFYSHRLDQLLVLAGLKPALTARAGLEVSFSDAWDVVRGWNEGARYDHSTTEDEARKMRIAVVDATVGVLPWLKTYW